MPSCNAPADLDIEPAAVAALDNVAAVVTSGRRLQGVAEALALGLTELSRLPCFSLEGGQLRHGPMEMLGPKVGVVLFRGQDATADLVDRHGRLGGRDRRAGRRLRLLRRGAGCRRDRRSSFAPASGLAAIFAMLPVAQRFMIAFADARVDNAGTPVRSTKITRSE